MTLLPFVLFLLQLPVACDVNGDGGVNVVDIQALVGVITGVAACPAGGGGPGTAQPFPFAAAVDSTRRILTIGSGCSVIAPCAFRFGSRVVQVPQPVTVTLAAGSGTVRAYAVGTGALTVGVEPTMTVTCAGGCVVEPAVGFPVDSIPLWTWTAAGGLWNELGGVSMQAALGRELVVAGAGLQSVTDGFGGVRLSLSDWRLIPLPDDEEFVGAAVVTVLGPTALFRLTVYRNGTRLRPVAEWAQSGQTVAVLVPVTPADRVAVEYRRK